MRPLSRCRPPTAAPALVLVATLLALAPASRAAVLETVGDAHARDDGRLLYREQHLVRRDGDRPLERLVLYRCPDGTAFARSTGLPA